MIWLLKYFSSAYVILENWADRCRRHAIFTTPNSLLDLCSLLRLLPKLVLLTWSLVLQARFGHITAGDVLASIYNDRLLFSDFCRHPRLSLAWSIGVISVSHLREIVPAPLDVVTFIGWNIRAFVWKKFSMHKPTLYSNGSDRLIRTTRRRFHLLIGSL